MRKEVSVLWLSVVLLVGGCGSKNMPHQTSDAFEPAIIELTQTTPIQGEELRVNVAALDEKGQLVSSNAHDFIWEIEDESIMKVLEPGRLQAIHPGMTTLTVSTLDGKVYTEYRQLVWPEGSFDLEKIEYSEQLDSQAAPGLSYSHLLNNWTEYSGKKVDLNGKYPCSPGTNDCGECAGFAKAFGNRTYGFSTQNWFARSRVLQTGSWPQLATSINQGDEIATMEPYLHNNNWHLRYSLADYQGAGHVALFHARGQSSTGVSINVRHQNLPTGQGISSYFLQVPKANGTTPTCPSTTGTDVLNACDYYVVQVGTPGL